MKIIGWVIQEYTYEFRTLGKVKAKPAVEFGNSSISDRKSREEYINELVARNVPFSVEPVFDNGV